MPKTSSLSPKQGMGTIMQLPDTYCLQQHALIHCVLKSCWNHTSVARFCTKWHCGYDYSKSEPSRQV